jgi:hypothetical protein
MPNAFAAPSRLACNEPARFALVSSVSSYGGDPDGTCNSCHRRNARTDFVQSAALQLAQRGP